MIKTITIKKVPFEQALKVIMATRDYSQIKVGNTLSEYILTGEEMHLNELYMQIGSLQRHLVEIKSEFDKVLKK